MAKKQRAKTQDLGLTTQPVASPAFDPDDEKTKPNIRLVQAMSGRPQYAKKELKLDFPTARLDAAGNQANTASWLPYFFGALMAFGFAYVQSGQVSKPAVKAETTTSAPQRVAEEPSAGRKFSSPLLDTVRVLGEKVQP